MLLASQQMILDEDIILIMIIQRMQHMKILIISRCSQSQSGSKSSREGDRRFGPFAARQAPTAPDRQESGTTLAGFRQEHEVPA